MNKMKNNKQNKKNIIIKRMSAIFVAVIVIFCSTIPCFAYTDNSENGIDFSEQPIPEATLTSNSYTDGFNLLEYGNALYYSASNNSNSVYLFAAPSSGIYAWYAVASSNTDNIHTFSYNTNTQNVNQITSATGNISNSTYFNDYNLYYKECGYYNSSLSGTTVNIPVFASIADGLSAVRDWIDNPPAPAPSEHPLQFTLPAGNIFIANVSGTESSILLGMHTPLLSWNPPVSQYMGFFSTIPSDLSIPISGTTPIDWQKAGKKDILGRTSNWVADSYVSNQNFVIITNPLNQDASQYSSNSNNLEVSAANADITINMSSVVEYRVYSLSQQFNISTGDWNVSQGEQSFSGNYDDTSQTWVTIDDATGNVSNPSYGGDNTPVVPNSISDWLENIASSISGFFTGAIGAVSNLVSAGSNFINSLQGLYSWLPPQVFSVLASALIIVITIGVIKVFI